MKKRIILLFIAYQAFAVPLTINFQMVVKDDSGRPIAFNGENITFSLTGNSGALFWSETKPISSPTGIINTQLGSFVSIDPATFYSQNDIKIVVKRSNGDTLLNEPFNAVPFAFKANVSDSSRNALLLQGRAPGDFLPQSFEATIRASISDSIAAHPALNPAGQVRDTANVVRGQVRGWIRDSIAAHPGIDYSLRISDTANALRNFSTAGDNSTKTQFRKDISDSLASRAYYYGHFYPNEIDSIPAKATSIVTIIISNGDTNFSPLYKVELGMFSSIGFVYPSQRDDGTDKQIYSTATSFTGAELPNKIALHYDSDANMLYLKSKLNKPLYIYFEFLPVLDYRLKR
jgi:hypothetical protein